ncbi:MAG: patatin-like phospholipase family protein, partial [Candidatus Marinimicrobia bacterium]|nr:patatin-like phospholipase family protein [Candidatus Neomarinimicrobiota bacterium]
SLIVGTSMGAVVGGVYACGRSAAWIEDYLENEFSLKDNVSLQTLKWGEGPVVKALQAGETLYHLRHHRGAESGEKMLQRLRDVTGDCTIESAKIPFACNAVDMISGKEKVFTKGNLAEAIRCSMAVPPFIEPYEIGESLFIDGAFADNLPVHIAREMGYRKIMSVDVVPLRPVLKTNIRNGYDVLFRALTCSIHHLHKGPGATVSLTAYRGAFNFDFDHVQELVAAGQQAVRDQEKIIRKRFDSWY